MSSAPGLAARLDGAPASSKADARAAGSGQEAVVGMDLGMDLEMESAPPPAAIAVIDTEGSIAQSLLLIPPSTSTPKVSNSKFQNLYLLL
jgi:hypothetical protein